MSKENWSLKVGEIVEVEISKLNVAESPRLAGEDEEHTARLAEIDDELPPILVHRSSMRVIDGMHRLRAAHIRGRTTINVVYFDGSDQDAYILAVAENTKHGLPLTLRDRRAAAGRIIGLRPELSDRRIGNYVGLADKTVSAIRRSTAGNVKLNVRIGADGRARPLNNTEGRERAERFISAHPKAPLREIAASSGVSLGTAHDVRKRMREPEAPPGEEPELVTAKAPRAPVDSCASQLDVAALLRRLCKDPALRYNSRGVGFLRWLQGHSISSAEVSQMVDAVPSHCSTLVVRLALESARAWQKFARELERKNRASYDLADPGQNRSVSM